MVNLILQYLNKIKQFFLIIPILIGIMIFAGLFFANQKSKPEFASKIDELMFSTKDKSPKYIITLPEEKKPEEQLANVDEDDDYPPKPKVVEESKEPDHPLTNNEKLSQLDIPFLAKIPPLEEEVEPLPYLQPQANLLEENSKNQRLPIKNDSMKPWEVYGRKVNVMPMFNKVAVVIKNMGVNNVNADVIISRLPAEISMSFSPYAAALSDFVKRARENGHETYMDMLLPSRDFARTDSGPSALDFNQNIEKNVEILEDILAQSIVVGGFTVCDGIDDEAYNKYFLAVMAMLEKRGLLMLDATHGSNIDANNVKGLDRLKADVVIDRKFNRTSIREKLAKAEKKALKDGSVVVVVEPKPVVILELYDWIKTFSQQLSYDEMKAQGITSFEKPLVLVPLSNLAREY